MNPGPKPSSAPTRPCTWPSVPARTAFWAPERPSHFPNNQGNNTMVYLLAGLILFLGVHSVRIVADGWRTHIRAQVGEGAYKGLYSLLSLLGFGLIIYGFALARETPVMLWMPPVGMRHAAS